MQVAFTSGTTTVASITSYSPLAGAVGLAFNPNTWALVATTGTAGAVYTVPYGGGAAAPAVAGTGSWFGVAVDGVGTIFAVQVRI